jgi:DNA-binding CsgD family transcriptional regulator
MATLRDTTTPLIVFATDAKGALTVTAGAGLAALGRAPGESVGKTVYDLAPSNHGLIDAIESALQGRHVTIRVLVNGRTLEATFVPQTDHRGAVIGLVGAAYDLTDEGEQPQCSDRVYMIRASRTDFGIILDAHDADGRHTNLIGRRCFTVFGGQDGTCTNCPASGRPSALPVTRVLQKSHEQDYQVVTAQWKAADVVQMRARTISEVLLSDLIRARIDQIASNAVLSGREREVFELMLLGRSPSDIAHVLGIKERTAKFHQANVLSKLGAESRYDLQRLVLQADAPAGSSRGTT